MSLTLVCFGELQRHTGYMLRAKCIPLGVSHASHNAWPLAGGIPEKAQLVAEAPQHWRPPPSFREGRSGKAPQVGQVAGVAKGHQGTVWVFHRYLPAHEYNTVQCMYI